MAKQQRVVVVGGGVIGLLTASTLATQGQAVVLLERAGVGQGVFLGGRRHCFAVVPVAL